MSLISVVLANTDHEGVIVLVVPRVQMLEHVALTVEARLRVVEVLGAHPHQDLCLLVETTHELGASGIRDFDVHKVPGHWLVSVVEAV